MDYGRSAPHLMSSGATTPTTAYAAGSGGAFGPPHHATGGDNIRVCARFRPLNRVEENLNAHLASTGIRDGAFNCIRFPSEMRDRVEIRVPEALLNAVERHENSGKGEDGFITDLMATFGDASLGGGKGMSVASRSESYIARSPSASSLSTAYQQGVPNMFGQSPSHATSSGNLSLAANNANNSMVAMTSHAFTYDYVFDPMVTQDAVYQEVGAPIVNDVMLGYNGTIFVYGQTGSGKTFSMMGAPLPNAPMLGERGRQGSVVGASAGTPRRGGNAGNAGPFSPGGYQNPRTQGYSSSMALQAPPQFDLTSPDGSGIIPRAVNHLFDCMYASPEEVSFTVSLFFVEIYMEKVRDLLVPDPSQSNLSIREDPKSSSFYIEGCVMADVTTPEEIFELLNYGIQNRATASTRMNVMSSRSHCLLCIAVHAFDSAANEQRIGKLFLVDLAGSEKVAKTKAEGQQLEEAKVINKSLTALGHVINQLSTKAPHIPYRDSKLTKILQDALGGNSKTTLIVCCSPSVRNLHETLSTLRFGQRAKTVKNRAVINKQHTLEELKVLLEAAKLEIDSLRKTSGGTNAPQHGLAISNNTLLEARFADEKKALIANIHALEDALRESNEAVDEEVAIRRKGERATALLKEENRLWESEYSNLHLEHQSASHNLADLKGQLACERDAMASLLQLMMDRKTDVARLREAAQKAVAQLQSELESSQVASNALLQQVAALKRKNAKLAEQNALLIEEKDRQKALYKLKDEERARIDKERAAADRRRETMPLPIEGAANAQSAFGTYVDSVNTTLSVLPSPPLTASTSFGHGAVGGASDRSGSPSANIPSLLGGGESAATSAAPSPSQHDRVAAFMHQQQLLSANASAKMAKEMLAASEEARDALQLTIVRLEGDNTALRLELQAMARKLQVRTDQRDNYQQGLTTEEESYRRLAGRRKEDVGHLKVQLLQCMRDAGLWRGKYNQLLLSLGNARDTGGRQQSAVAPKSLRDEVNSQPTTVAANSKPTAAAAAHTSITASTSGSAFITNLSPRQLVAQGSPSSPANSADSAGGEYRRHPAAESAQSAPHNPHSLIDFGDPHNTHHDDDDDNYYTDNTRVNPRSDGAKQRSSQQSPPLQADSSPKEPLTQYNNQRQQQQQPMRSSAVFRQSSLPFVTDDPTRLNASRVLDKNAIIGGGGGRTTGTGNNGVNPSSLLAGGGGVGSHSYTLPPDAIRRFVEGGATSSRRSPPRMLDGMPLQQVESEGDDEDATDARQQPQQRSSNGGKRGSGTEAGGTSSHRRLASTTLPNVGATSPPHRPDASSAPARRHSDDPLQQQQQSTNSPNPHDPSVDRPAGLVNVNLASYLDNNDGADDGGGEGRGGSGNGGGTAKGFRASPASPIGGGGGGVLDVASPLLSGSAVIRVGAGGFGAPSAIYMATSVNGGASSTILIPDGSFNNKGSIKGRKPSASVPHHNATAPGGGAVASPLLVVGGGGRGRSSGSPHHSSHDQQPSGAAAVTVTNSNSGVGGANTSGLRASGYQHHDIDDSGRISSHTPNNAANATISGISHNVNNFSTGNRTSSGGYLGIHPPSNEWSEGRPTPISDSSRRGSSGQQPHRQYHHDEYEHEGGVVGDGNPVVPAAAVPEVDLDQL